MSKKPKLPQCLAILGPTCSGKSSVAIYLAKKLNASIISCDSMQIYKQMDIGTAKPSKQQQQQIKHFLIDELNISQPYNANLFVEKTKTIIDNPTANKKIFLIVGGTGMYAKTLIYDYKMLPSDKKIFQQIIHEKDAPNGINNLIKEIETKANFTIRKEIYNNPRRLMRAVEVLRITGKLHQEIFFPKEKPKPNPRFTQYILMPELSVLRQQIPQRTEQMIDKGWIDEVRYLLKKDLLNTPTARQSLGYKQIAQYITSPQPQTKQQLIDLISTKTVQYARRQRTWFKNQHQGSTIIPINQPTPTENLADNIYQDLQNRYQLPYPHNHI